MKAMTVRIFSLAFDLVAVSNEPFCLGMSNLVRRLTITMLTRYAANDSEQSQTWVRSETLMLYPTKLTF